MMSISPILEDYNTSQHKPVPEDIKQPSGYKDYYGVTSKSNENKKKLHKKDYGLSDIKVTCKTVGFIGFLVGLFMILANRMKINDLSDRVSRSNTKT